MGLICMTATIVLSAVIFYQGSDYAIYKVESLLKQQLDAEINVQKISIHIWKQQLTLHNVRIDSSTQIPLAGCQALSLSIAFSSLFSDTIQIKNLQMIRPWLYLPVDKNRPLNFQQVLPFFSFINQLMKKRIFSIRQTQRKKTLFLQSLDLLDGTLYFSQTAQEKSFRVKHFTINTSKNNLNLSGILSFAVDQGLEMQVLEFKTTGSYSEKNLAHPVMTLFSSQSPEIFYDRFLNIVKKLHFQSNGAIKLSDTLFQQIGSIHNKISGTINGSFELNALSDSPKMNVSVAFDGTHIDRIPITKMVFHANVEEQLLTVNEIRLETKDSQVKIQGVMNLHKFFSHNIMNADKNWKHLTWQFFVDSNNFPLYHFHDALPKCSRFNGTMRIKGQGLDIDSFLSDIAIHGQTHIPQNLCFLPETTFKYDVTAHAESDKLTVREMTAQAEGIVVTAHGHVNPQMVGELSINSKISGQWLSYFGLPELTSDFDTALTVHRSISKTKAHMQLTGKQLALNQYQLGDLNVDASISIPGKMIIKNASLSKPSSELDTRGVLVWDDITKIFTSVPDSYDLSIHSENIQLQEIHPGLAGNVTIDGNLMGTIKKASGQILLNGHTFSIFGQRLKSVNFPLEIMNDRIRMSSGNIRMDEKEQMVIDFTLDRNKNYQFKIDSSPISLSHIKGCIPEIQGKFKINIDGKGNVQQPQFNGNIVVSPIFFQNKPLPDAVFKIASAQDILTLRCKSMLEVDAQYYLKKGHFDMRAQAKKMPLSPVLTCFGLSQFKGQVSGIFQMAGQLNDILNSRGSLQIKHAALAYKNIPLIRIDPFYLMIENKELTDAKYNIHLPEKGYCRGTVYGKIPEQTHLKINSLFPLAAMRNFTDSISDISGKLKLDGTLHHFMTAPMFEGHIRMIDGEFINIWNNQHVHHIMGQIDAKDHIFALKHFSFGVDDGNCELKGKMILDKQKISQVNLSGAVSAIPIYIPGISELMLNAKLNYSRKYQKGRLTGNVEFLEGLYYQNVSINQMLLERLQKKRRPDMVDQICQFFPPICRTELDISIQSRLPLIADNDLAYMEIHPDLSIRGTIYNPVILGRTELLNGEIKYLGKTFVLDKGLIDFVNPYRTEPMIDIQSNVAVRDWQISLDVLGKPEALQVKLSSTPEEEHADIISILLFGKPAHQLFVQDTGPYKSTQQMIAELLSSAFEDDIKNTTGLDTFHLEAYEHETVDDNQNDDYKITLGKELSPRMSITYAFETRKGQLIHHTQANYKLFENLIIRGMQDTQGTYGGELLLHMEFRELPGF